MNDRAPVGRRAEDHESALVVGLRAEIELLTAQLVVSEALRDRSWRYRLFRIIELIADDGYAATFLTMGAYRAALLQNLRRKA